MIIEQEVKTKNHISHFYNLHKDGNLQHRIHDYKKMYVRKLQYLNRIYDFMEKV